MPNPICPIPEMSYKRTANLAISKDKTRSCKLRWDSLLQFCSPRSAWPRRSSVIPPARITLPLFHAQITFDTITRERVAARVSAQSADVQYLDSAVEAKACYYDYRRNGVRD